MIQHIIKERKKIWIIIAYMIATALIYGLSLNDASSLEISMAMISFSLGMGLSFLIALLSFIVIEDKIEFRPKWSRRFLRLVSLLLISLAIGGVMDSRHYWSNYFVLWLAFGEKHKIKIHKEILHDKK